MPFRLGAPQKPRLCSEGARIYYYFRTSHETFTHAVFGYFLFSTICTISQQRLRCDFINNKETSQVSVQDQASGEWCEERIGCVGVSMFDTYKRREIQSCT